MNRITGKVILITGASSGIGEATARLLAEKGAIIILTGRNENKLEAITSQIIKDGARADYYQLDVTDQKDFNSCVNVILKKYGHIDVLINNAGIMLLSSVNELKVNEWKAMLDVNLKGVLNGTASVLPSMREQGKGMIVNVISTAAYRVMENSSVYSATKSAVRFFSDGLRKEESNNGIRVCLIAPGPTKTNLLNHVTSNDVRTSLSNYVDNFGLNAIDIADAIAYQINAPESVSIDEMIISPTHKL